MADFRKFSRFLTSIQPYGISVFFTIRTIFFSGLISVLVKLVGLYKEKTIANSLGLSAPSDIYYLLLLIFVFFVGPISGSIGILLTQKLVEINISNSFSKTSIYKKCVNFALLFMTPTAFVLALLCIVAGIFDIKPFSLLDNKIIIVFLIPITIFSSLTVINYAVLSSEKKFFLQTLNPTLVPLIIIGFVYFNPYGDFLSSLVIGTMVGFGFETLSSFYFARNIFSKSIFVSNDFEKHFSKIKQGLSPLFAASMVMGGCAVIDQFMASIAGPGSVSAINFGSRIPFGLISIVGILWMVLFPIFSEMVSKKHHNELFRMYTFITLIAIIGFSLFCLLISFFSYSIVDFVFGGGVFATKEADIVSKIQIFYLLFIPFYVHCLISSRVISSYEKHATILRCNMKTLLLNFCLNLLFINYFGVIGVALATLCAYIVSSIIWHRQILLLKKEIILISKT